MDLEGVNRYNYKFNYYLAILGNNAEYEGEPNNCKCSTKC